MSDENELEDFVVMMEKTLTTYKILLEDEIEREQKKGMSEPNPNYYTGCVDAITSLLFLASEFKRRKHERMAEEINTRKLKNDSSSNN